MNFYSKSFWALSFFMGMTSNSLGIKPEQPALESDTSPVPVRQRIQRFQDLSETPKSTYPAPPARFSLSSIENRRKAFENYGRTGRISASVAQGNEENTPSPSTTPLSRQYSKKSLTSLVHRTVFLPEIANCISQYLDEQSLSSLREACRTTYHMYNSKQLTLDLSRLQPKGDRTEESLIQYLRHHPLLQHITLKRNPATYNFLKAFKKGGLSPDQVLSFSLPNTGARAVTFYPLAAFQNLEEIDASNEEDSEETLPQNKIKSLAPFLMFPRLKTLNLSGNPVFNVSDVKELNELRSLLLDRHTLSQADADNLGSAPWLQNLSVSAPWDGSQGILGNASFLQNLTNLTHLSIANHGLASLPNLSPHLVKLDVSHNGLRNLQFASSLTKLQVLLAAENQIDSADPLRNLKNLKEVNLKGNFLSSTEPFSDLVNLVDLNLGVNLLTSVRPLKDLSRLEKLRLNKNHLTTIEGVSSLSKLEVLDISDTNISSFIPLSRLKGLITLYADNTEVVDVGPLAVLRPSSVYLNGSSKLKSIAPLAKIKGLSALYLDDVQVPDFASLKKAKTLTFLHLNRTGISDLTWIAQLPKLYSVYLEGNGLTYKNVKPLKNSQSLKLISLLDNDGLLPEHYTRLRNKMPGVEIQ